jgi:hypothetical protein
MKRLLFLTLLSIVAADAAGCSRARQACRPACVPTPACIPACGGGAEAYATPGTVITTTPGTIMSSTVVSPTIPGPETYAPATNP